MSISETPSQLVHNLRHRKKYKRLQAAQALQQFNDEVVVDALIKALSDASRTGANFGNFTDGSRVCDVAAESLETIGTPAAISAVVAWREDPFPFFRKAFDLCDDSIELPAIREIAAIGGDRAVDALLIAMGGYSQTVFDRTVDALTKMGQMALPGLHSHLFNGNPYRRWTAAYVLGKIGDPLSVEVLIEVLLYDSAPRVRGHVAKALGNIGDVRAIPALIRRLSDKSLHNSYSQKPLVCDVAAEALIRIGTSEALEAVEKWQIDTPTST